MDRYFDNTCARILAETKIRDIGGTYIPAVMQKKTKPPIEDILCQYLDDESLKQALYITNNIHEHNMIIKWKSCNVWTVKYKRKHVCDLKIEKGALHIGEVSGVLAIRVTNKSYDRDSINRLIGSLKNSIASTQEPILALQ